MAILQPPLLAAAPLAGMNPKVKKVITWGALPVFLLAVLLALRLLGLIYPFHIPSGGMAPAISPGDHVMAEGFTFLMRKPHRGDIVAFRTKGIAGLPPATMFSQRIAGEPGERVCIIDGQLYINDKRTLITNDTGAIVYTLPQRWGLAFTNLTVPQGQYYMLGDNSNNSLDSRYWGCLPASNIFGRMWFCYSPPERRRVVK
jgi:signal peptidase I